MNTKISIRISRAIIGMVFALQVLASPASLQTVQAARGYQAVNYKMNGRQAFAGYDDGEQTLTLTVTQDEIANLTTLFFAYSFPDPNDSNLRIVVLGEEGQIPNSAFSMNASSARLTLTTPDTYPVTRCVVNDETGEYSCAPTLPSTFDLAWREDGMSHEHLSSTLVETQDSQAWRTIGRAEILSAEVTGTWDGRTGTDGIGMLLDNENSTLLRETMMKSYPLLLSPSGLKARIQAAGKPMTQLNGNGAHVFLEREGLNGFLTASHDQTTNTSKLDFSYAFPDENDPEIMLLYQGSDEIPNSAFTMNSAFARLRYTTPDSYYINRCVLNIVTGYYACARASTQMMFDLTWTKDRGDSIRETRSDVLTLGSATTRSHTVFNLDGAAVSGTWKEFIEHTGTNMNGTLGNDQSVTVGQGGP
jgi:hypothetical protein